MKRVKSSTHDASLPTKLSKLFEELVFNEKHCDAVIVIGGEKFPCHKAILALQTDYFTGLIFSKQRVDLSNTGIDAACFRNILRFIYTGEVDLGMDNVEAVIEAATIMTLPDLRTLCVDTMIDWISATNVMKYRKLAERLNETRLLAACARAFESSSQADLLEYIRGDDQLVHREIEICEMVLSWINSHSGSQNEAIDTHQLLTAIRWSGVPLQYIQTKMATNKAIKSNAESWKFLKNVISYRLTGISDVDIRTFHRPSTGQEQCLFVLAKGHGYNRSAASTLYSISLQRTDIIQRLESLPTDIHPETAACVLNGDLFVTGVGKTWNESWVWNLAGGWSSCANLIIGRRRHCAVAFPSSTEVYVVGGIDKTEKTLGSVELYSRAGNVWSEAGYLQKPTNNAAAVAVGTSIYVFGGHASVDDSPIDSVQVYDTSSSTCTLLLTCLPRATGCLRAVSWGKFVLLLSFDQCLVFDIKMNRIDIKDARLAPKLLHFGLVIENETLFVVGGGTVYVDARGETWDCTDQVRSIPLKDVIRMSGDWVDHATLEFPSCVHSFGVMTLPLNAQTTRSLAKTNCSRRRSSCRVKRPRPMYDESVDDDSDDTTNSE